ncbi:MAG: hypothetical protein HN725_00420 [Alphaproteobacteria bacterium]|mgnify:FL=1|jgi:hypothetical protein|nr:hypothetical protein [Alphaproteobacteria bacterium]MBT4086772.1 hypothetical protein [Alphaproteobacteria bacterium]MBT4546538.1 hypothetical protein [Alphaproteobacteria bacterium]MBT7743721.1 hypothetical protein [Alphaproteobacteria bacterium]
MAILWTEDRVKVLSSSDRRNLYENAKSHGSPEGDALVELIKRVGLSDQKHSGIDMDDPLFFRIHEIINSPVGRDAAVNAAKDGLPALAGVDPLVSADLKQDYGKHNMTTHTAGSLVAILMRELGYREAGRSAALPDNCVARSGQIWE